MEMSVKLKRSFFVVVFFMVNLQDYVGKDLAMQMLDSSLGQKF